MKTYTLYGNGTRKLGTISSEEDKGNLESYLLAGAFTIVPFKEETAEEKEEKEKVEEDYGEIVSIEEVRQLALLTRNVRIETATKDVSAKIRSAASKGFNQTEVLLDADLHYDVSVRFRKKGFKVNTLEYKLISVKRVEISWEL